MDISNPDSTDDQLERHEREEMRLPSAATVSVDHLSTTVCSALHLPLTMSPQSVHLPQAPDELTLRAVQFQQACWDAGRPARREKALAAGTFEGEFDRLDAAKTPAATALSHLATGEWVDVSARSGGEVCGLARHNYGYLFNEPLAIENISSLPPQAQEKFTEKSLTSVSMHVRQFDRPYDAAVHVTRRETAFLQSPFSGKPPMERNTGNLSPILPSSVVLNSPMKKRMAAIHDASSSCGDARESTSTTPPPSRNSQRQDPFAFAASADPLRQWDAIKVPCELRRISCSSVDSAKWALSAQGTPYAYVLVPMTSPPTWNWVRVNSGHVDPDSVAGMVTRKCHVGSFSTLCCGNATCVWGVSQDALDNGRCVARIGFTENAPNGTDWLNMSGGVMPDPPTASERAQYQFEQYAATRRASTKATAVGLASSGAVGRRFQHVSVGMDGSVWAVVIAATNDAAVPAERVSSVWVREGARGSSLGTRWTPLALSQEAFDYSRPYDPSRRKPYFEFMRLTHQVFHSVFALVAESPEQLAIDAGSVYERCGISGHNLVGDCWRKILLDPSPPRATSLTLPVQLSVIPAVPPEVSETLVRALSVAADGGAWLIDVHRDLFDATNCFARARANPTNIILHDRFPGVENFRDSSIDGDLCFPDRSDLMPLIHRFFSSRQHERGVEGSSSMVLTSEEHQHILTTSSLLDMSSLRSLIPDADAVLTSTPLGIGTLITLEDVDAETFASGASSGPYALHFSWRLYPDAPALTFGIKTQPHVVFDPLRLQKITAQVPETVRWTWCPIAPLPSLLSSASSGSLRNGAGYDILHRLIGADFLKQLDNTSPTLDPALSACLQLHYTTSLPSAAMHSGASWIESVVHRDVAFDESAFEALQLIDPSLRRFEHVQTRRLTVRSKLMLCGAARTVTVVSQAPLGVPTPTVVVLCNDFDWAPHNKQPLLATFPCSTSSSQQHHGVAASSRYGVGSFASLAASLLAPWRATDSQRQDNPFKHDALQGLSHTDATAAAQETAQASAMKRYTVDVLDLVDTACRTFDWDLEYVALANDSVLIFPHEGRFDAAVSNIQRRPHQETYALEMHQNSDRSVLLKPGFSMVCSLRQEDALISQLERTAAAHGVSEQTVNVFTALLKRLMCPEASKGSAATVPSLLLAANVSERLSAAASLTGAVSSSSSSSAIDALTRTITFASGVLGGLDLLGAVKDRWVHMASMQPLQQCVQLELLQPELIIVVEESAPNCHSSYSKTYRSGPAVSQGTFSGCGSNGGSSTVKIVKVAITGQMRFQVNNHLRNETNHNAERHWAGTQLPPSFSSSGEIVLFDAKKNSIDRDCGDASTLSFVGPTSLINWSLPSGIDGACMVHPSVEVVMQLSYAKAMPPADTARLDGLLELVEMRLVGEGILNGLLFEHGTVQFPVLEGGNPEAYCDVFGPSILRVQRRSVPLGELCRSVRMAAIAKRTQQSEASHKINVIDVASRDVDVLERALDRCCRLRHAECIAAPQQICAASLSSREMTGRDVPLLDLPRQGFCTTAGRIVDPSCLLSGQYITISPVAVHPPSQNEASHPIHHPMCFLGDPIGDGSFGFCSRSANADLVWTLVKTTRNSQHHRAAHLDPILRHGDCVTLHHVRSGTSLGEGAVGDNDGEGFKWIIGRQGEAPTAEGDEGESPSCASSPWEPLRHNDAFTLTNAWSDTCFLIASAPPPQPHATATEGAVVVTATSWRAAPALIDAPLFMEATPCQFLGQPAIATVASHNLCQLVDPFNGATTETHSGEGNSVGGAAAAAQQAHEARVCTVSATLAHPLVLGHRTYDRGVLIALCDVDDAARGCSFSIDLKELHQHTQHAATTDVAPPPTFQDVPSDVAPPPTFQDVPSDDQGTVPAEAHSEDVAEAPSDSNVEEMCTTEAQLMAPLNVTAAASAITSPPAMITTTAIQYRLDFHFRDTALRFLGAHARCVGSSLNNGVAGLALNDVVLHVVAHYSMGPSHCLVPPLEQPSLTSTYEKRSTTTMNATDMSGMHLCSEHQDSVALQFALEVPLERCSMLLPIPPSCLNVPSDVTTLESMSLFDSASAFSSATVEGDIRCLGCLERIEETMRTMVRRKSTAAASMAVQTLKNVTDRLVQVRAALNSAQAHVDLQMEHHTSAMLPDEVSAKTELRELTSHLTQLIRRLEALDLKIDQKPHKAPFYQLQRLLLAEQRQDLMLAIDRAKDVHAHQRNVLSDDVASLIKSNSNIAALQTEMCGLLAQKESCEKLLDLAAVSASASQSCPPATGGAIDALIAWALRSVKLHGWSNPTSETCSSQACVEFLFDLIPRASGRMDLSNGGPTPLTSLSLLDPDDSLTGHGRASTSYMRPPSSIAAASQTAESFAIVLPFDTQDVQSEGAMPLRSFQLFCELVLEPVASRWIADCLAKTLKARYGLCDEDINLLAGAKSNLGDDLMK